MYPAKHNSGHVMPWPAAPVRPHYLRRREPVHSVPRPPRYAGTDTATQPSTLSRPSSAQPSKRPPTHGGAAQVKARFPGHPAEPGDEPYKFTFPLPDSQLE